MKNSLSRVVHAVSNDEAGVLVETDGVPAAAIISVGDLRKLVDIERLNRDQEAEDPWAVIGRMREAFTVAILNPGALLALLEAEAQTP